MENISTLVNRALSGDADAYGILVRRFQDMAVGYGYSMLRDFQLAEDAAQEAFFKACRNFSKLREPAAFPGWFRLIVFKQCDRILREKHPAMVPLEDVAERASTETGQVQMMEERETSDKIFEAINALPEHERVTTMLFYIGGHSLKEVGEFLGAPVTAVKKRLHMVRGRLREALLDTFQETLRDRRPSRDEIFASRVMGILTAARAGDADTVKALLEQGPRLLFAREMARGYPALGVRTRSLRSRRSSMGIWSDYHGERWVVVLIDTSIYRGVMERREPSELFQQFRGRAPARHQAIGANKPLKRLEASLFQNTPLKRGVNGRSLRDVSILWALPGTCFRAASSDALSLRSRRQHVAWGEVPPGRDGTPGTTSANNSSLRSRR